MGNLMGVSLAAVMAAYIAVGGGLETLMDARAELIDVWAQVRAILDAVSRG